MPSLGTLTIDALVDKSGVEAEDIESYRRLGLLLKPRRTVEGLLLYPPDEVGRVVFIRRALDLGFSSLAIREMLGLGCRKQPTCREIRDVVERQLADVRRRRAALARIEQVLATLIENCPRSDARNDCSIIAALSQYVPKES